MARVSLPWMESTDAKLDRAGVHLDAYRAAARAWVDKTRPTFIRKVDRQRHTHWLVLYVEDAQPPVDLSPIIGDCLYNTLSALDCLVCGLVRTKNSSSTCAGRQFPIYVDSGKYVLASKDALRGVPKDALRLINELQPYCRGERTKELDPLWILKTLCNSDKHRSALLALCYFKNVQISIPRRDGSTLRFALPRTIYADQPQMIDLPGPLNSFDDYLQIQAGGTSQLVFRDAGPWSERPVDEVLVACLEYVKDRVVPRFKPFFT
jgi:hypothetical protein